MPNIRLVWNYELGGRSITDIRCEAKNHADIPEGAHSEYRLFYPENAVITLPLSAEFEHFSHWEYKERQDSYYLVPNQHLNIKSRKDKLLYKPLLKEQGNIYWFAPKQRLDKPNTISTHASIPNDLEARRLWLKQQSTVVSVQKDAFITELHQGRLLFEIAKLRFNNRIFYTVGLEAKPSLSLLDLIAQLDHQNASTQHYVAFLKTHMGIPL